MSTIVALDKKRNAGSEDARPPLSSRGARAPRDVPASPKVGTRYAKLLTAKTGMVPPIFERPLLRAHRALETLARQGGEASDAYQKAADSLRFPASFDAPKWSPVEWALALLSWTGVGQIVTRPLEQREVWTLAKKAMTELKQTGRLVVPCCRNFHYTLMEIVAEHSDQDPERDTYTIRNHNAAGLSKWHRHERRDAKRKIQSVYEVAGARLGEGKDKINVRELAKLWALESLLVTLDLVRGKLDTDLIYRWMLRKGKPNDAPQVMQGRQKAGNCSQKSIHAYLRNSLTDVEYCEAMAHLYETAVQAYEGPSHLKQALEKNAEQRRDKARIARCRQAFVEAASQHAWFCDSYDDVRRALRTPPRTGIAVYYDKHWRTAYICHIDEAGSVRRDKIECDVRGGRPSYCAWFAGSHSKTLEMHGTARSLVEAIQIRYDGQTAAVRAGTARGGDAFAEFVI